MANGMGRRPGPSQVPMGHANDAKLFVSAPVAIAPKQIVRVHQAETGLSGGFAEEGP
jgi:hypothetical protein